MAYYSKLNKNKMSRALTATVVSLGVRHEEWEVGY